MRRVQPRRRPCRQLRRGRRWTILSRAGSRWTAPSCARPGGELTLRNTILALYKRQTSTAEEWMIQDPDSYLGCLADPEHRR